MHNLFLTQNGYTKNGNEQQSVAIAIRNNGFSFVIRTQSSIAALCYVSVSTINTAEYEQSLREFLQHDLLQQSFTNCSIIYSNQAVSVIPHEFYAEQYAQALFALTQPLTTGETVENYRLKNNNATIVYALPHNIVKICNETLKTNCRFLPQTAPFLERSFAHNTIMHKKTLYISLESFHCEATVINGNKLEFYNNFAFQTVNDFVYLVLNLCKQLGLPPKEIHVELSGKISAAASYCKSLQLFVPQVNVAQQLNNIPQFPFNPVLYSVFSNLISIELCE